jgi:translation initiation factor 1 (eIF-1/SUI1)
VSADIPGDVLGAALLQLASHGERLSGLDAREAAHYQELAPRVHDLAAKAVSVKVTITRINETLRRHSMIVNGLDGLDRQVEELTRSLAQPAASGVDDGQRGYQPVSPPRWWKLDGRERDTMTDRLRAWVEQIYKPGYGQIAATLPACWEQHTLCLYTLDWLSELWSFLYLGPERTGVTLGAQAEWQTRLLPAAAGQMAFEATRCSHSTTNPRRPDGPGCPP